MKTNSATIKGIIVMAILMVSVIFIMKYASTNQAIVISLFLVSLFIFNFVVRGLPSFKPYFLSPFNFLSDKSTITKHLDLPKTILIEKFEEVILAAGFKVKQVNEEQGTLFAIVGLSWKTWGENIYVEIDENGITKFYSVAVVGVSSWGKNDCNLRKLVNTFESSLTI